MRFSACCWLSLVLAAAALADPSQPPSELARVLDRMASSRGVEASFRERKELGLLASPLESRGVIYFAAPDRFARFTLRPGFTALVVSGDDVRLREGRDGETVDLSDSPVARVFVENFVALWSGDRERLERLYVVEFLGDLEHWELRLVPRRKPLSDVIAAISLRGSADRLREMLVAERDGDRTTTIFESLREDRAFSPRELERIFVSGEPLEGASAER
jgi:hypothetical protein